MSQVTPSALVGPTEERSLAIDLDPTLTYNGSNYIAVPPSCHDSLMACLCPFSQWLTFQAAGDKEIKYSNKCCCCSPWAANVDGQVVGYLRQGGICDQTAKFIFCTFCCPCINCTCNEVVMLKVSDASDVKKMTMLMKDNPCTRLCGCFVPFCSVCSSSCCDCMAYACNNQNTVIIAESFFDTGRDKNKTEIGQVNTVFKLMPVGCFVVRVMTRYSIKMKAQPEYLSMLPTMLLLPMMQSGAINNPCVCCKANLLPPASGSMCDCGRFVQFKRAKFSEMLTMTEAVTGGAPPAAELGDDEFPTVYEWNASSGGRHVDPNCQSATDLSNPWVVAEQMLRD